MNSSLMRAIALILVVAYSGHVYSLPDKSQHAEDTEEEDSRTTGSKQLDSLASLFFAFGLVRDDRVTRCRRISGNSLHGINCAGISVLDASLPRIGRSSGLLMQATDDMDLADMVDSWVKEEEGDQMDSMEFDEESPQIEDSSPTALTDDICLLPGEAQVRIEVAPENSRRIFTGIDIFAPIDIIWASLTDYEKLGDVVPSVVSNEVVFRTSDGGARLSQVGAAKVLPGVTFRAKTILDVVPYDEDHPIPPRMLLENLPVSTLDSKEREYFAKVPLKRGVFPRPYAYTSLPHRDLTMQNVLGEGDFNHYQGVWRMQQLPNCAPPGQFATRLTYAVEIQPKSFLPVVLIERKIASELKENMKAIKFHVETSIASEG